MAICFVVRSNNCRRESVVGMRHLPYTRPYVCMRICKPPPNLVNKQPACIPIKLTLEKNAGNRKNKSYAYELCVSL